MPKNNKKQQKVPEVEGIKKAGNDLYAQGRYRDAVKKYTECIVQTSAPDQAVYYSNRANCHLGLA